ncbi:MAG TPA: glycosyltransferase family 2 protein [Cytophagales bacterium]|nr:glycosyltransferase family 2 protein [Cytophagales bacterium]
MQKVAIVILNFNGCKFLEKFLPGLLEHSSTYPIYVIDNNSSDNSLELLKAKFPQVRVIVHDRNYGFCQGYNLGLVQINAQYYILLNSDIEVTANWIDPVIELMEKDPSIAACQPKIKAYHDKESFEYAGAAGGFIDKWGYPFCRGRVFNTLEKDENQYDTNLEIFWATGACFFVRSDAFHQLEGLDKDFFAHMEEIDLCWRLKARGYKIFYCTDSEVYHVGGGTLPMDSPKKTYYNFRNGLFMLYKNLPADRLYFVVFVRLLLDYLTFVKFALSGTFTKAFSIIKAHIDFFKEIGNLKIKRKKNFIVEDYKKMTGVYGRSLFIDYFILQKKKFEELPPLNENKPSF